MIKKKNIYIDRFQQQKENNMSLLDYPVFNIETGRQLKHRFGYYFKNMDEYYTTKNPEFKNWSKKYKHTSYKAYKFFDDVEHKEYRF
jgi:hypothetical protein